MTGDLWYILHIPICRGTESKVSNENPQTPTNEAESQHLASMPTENVEVTINKATNEISLKDPATDRIITFKANVIEQEEEIEEEDEEVFPLTPDEFRDALQSIDSLGLTWSAGRPLYVKAKSAVSEQNLYSEEFREIQHKYPSLPRELTAVVYYALTGRDTPESITGDRAGLELKASVVRELVATPAFRSEFFFKNAIKVPYIESIDWEVVIKTREKNVIHMPGTAYALLLLTFHNTNPTIGEIDKHQNITAAVDIHLVNKLLRTLVEIKGALEETQELGGFLDQQTKPEGKDHATSSSETSLSRI